MSQRKTTTTNMGVERARPPGKYSRSERNCCLWPPDLDERSHRLKMNVPEISLLSSPSQTENPLDGGGPFKIFSDESMVENTNSEDFLKDFFVSEKSSSF